MSKYKGAKVQGVEFYHLLYQSPGFTSELGRVILASSKLESALFTFLKRKGVQIDHKKSALGHLIKLLKTKKLTDEKLILNLDAVKKQRNYLIHNIHALLSDMIPETILDRNDLIDSDVHTYQQRATQLIQNLNGLRAIFEKLNDS